MKRLWVPALSFLALLPLAANSLVVTTRNDENANPPGAELSLREAIQQAEDSASTITFDSSLASQRILVYRDSLFIEDPDNSNGVNEPLTIDASNLPHPLVIAAPSLPQGKSLFELVDRSLILKNVIIEDAPYHGINATEGDKEDLTLEDVTIRFCGASAINFASRNLLMERCEIHRNGENWTPENGTSYYGVRFINGRTLTARDSTFYHNHGGGLSIGGPAETRFHQAFLSNCTLAENTLSEATSKAGGLHASGSLPVLISSCTIVDNVGGGLSGQENVSIVGSIVARNVAATSGDPLNIINHPLTPIDSMGHNLSDTTPAALDDEDDLRNTEPLLSRLGYFGGPVLTCYPQVGSPAIDGGNPSHPEVFFEGRSDARGFDRRASHSNQSASNIRDIGAVEVDTIYPYTVRSTSTGGTATLDTLISAQDFGHKRVTFDPELSGQTIEISFQEISNGNHVDFDASNLAEPIILKAKSNNRGLWLHEGGTASFQNIRFESEGATTAEALVSVWSDSRVGFQRCHFSNNARTTVSTGLNSGLRSRFHFNECFFHDNSAVVNVAFTGGNLSAPSQFWNSTFARNTITGNNSNGALLAFSGTPNTLIEFRNCTFANNEGGQAGTGSVIWTNGSRLELDHCTFADFTGPASMTLENSQDDRFTNSLFANNAHPSAEQNGDIHLANRITQPRSAGNFSTLSDNNYAPESPITLAPLGDYGGAVPTRPLVSDSPLIGGNPSALRRAADAHYTVFPVPSAPTPGAVSQGVSLLPGSVEVEILAFEADQVQLLITGSGTRDLQVYGGSNLESLTPLGNSFALNSTEPEEKTVTLPESGLPRYFLQVRETY